MPGTAGFIPVLHAATLSRPDEIDTIAAAESVAGALSRLGYATEVIGLDQDLAGIDALMPRRPLLVFNIVDAVAGDCRLAPTVPARLDALGLPYTGAGTSAWLETLSKVGTKLKLEHAGLPTPEWSEDGTGLGPMPASSSSRCGSMARSASGPTRWCSAPTRRAPSSSGRCAGTPIISRKAISTGGNSPRP